MAKYKKKYYSKKKVLKAISKYHRTKYNFIFDLLVDNEGNYFIDGQQSNSLIIGEMLTGNTAEFQTLGKQYAFVKCRSISIEAICNEVSVNRYNFALCLCQTNDSIVFGNIRNQPNIVLLNPQGKSRGFFKISSEFTSTNDIQLFNNVALKPMSSGTGRGRYTIKCTLYLTFKTNL